MWSGSYEIFVSLRGGGTKILSLGGVAPVNEVGVGWTYFIAHCGEPLVAICF